MNIYEKITGTVNSGLGKALAPGPVAAEPTAPAAPQISTGIPENLCGRFETEPSCWGGKCQHVERLTDEFGWSSNVCTVSGKAMVDLNQCPLDRWYMVDPREGEAYGQVVISPWKAKR